MATDQGPEGSLPPAHNEQAPAPNIRYVDPNGNPVPPPQQQVVVVQPQPNIRYVDQNGNPVAPFKHNYSQSLNM